MLSVAQDIGSFKGINLSFRSPPITHLFFADDLMIFFKASLTSLQGKLLTLLNPPLNSRLISHLLPVT